MKVLILDVDGVLTSGSFIYSAEGKMFKCFGPDDNDAISLLAKFIKVRCITGDRKGFEISRRRIVEDMNLRLDLVSTIKRTSWIADQYELAEVIYMGDGIFDHYVMKRVSYSIATNDSDSNAKKYANFVTKRNGGNRAVAEACMHIMKKFFIKYNPEKKLNKNIKFSGKWKT